MSPVESVFETFKSAVAEKNVDRLVDLYEEKVLLFDTWDAWSMSGREAWRSAVSEWFGSLGGERLTVEFEPIKEVATETLISVSGFVTYTALSTEGAKLRSNKERLTWILLRKPEGWRIAHCHNSLPLDFRTGKARSND